MAINNVVVWCRNRIRYDLFIVYSVSDFIHLSLRRLDNKSKHNNAICTCTHTTPTEKTIDIFDQNVQWVIRWYKAIYIICPSTFIHRCNSLCYIRFSCFLHSVANSLKTMQHTVAKHFIYCKHNITLWNTQVIPQKVVTFFEECKSWSHTSLFVWDWNYRARRIASNFTRFYRIAKGVTRRIWLDQCPMSRHPLTSWHRKRSRNLCSSNSWFRRDSNPRPTA